MGQTCRWKGWSIGLVLVIVHSSMAPARAVWSTRVGSKDRPSIVNAEPLEPHPHPHPHGEGERAAVADGGATKIPGSGQRGHGGDGCGRGSGDGQGGQVDR